MVRRIGILIAVLLVSAIAVTAQDSGERDPFLTEFTVTTPDLEAGNGVVHVIDAVLLPPSVVETMLAEDAAASAEATEPAEMTEVADLEEVSEAMEETEAAEATEGAEATESAEPQTVVDVITESPEHTMLLQALDAAGLTQSLAGTGPFTVFAPTNAAFETLLADLELTAEDLLADTDLLTAVLNYHVVEGDALLSSDLTVVTTLTTLGGEEITIGLGDAADEVEEIVEEAEMTAPADVTPEATAEDE